MAHWLIFILRFLSLGLRHFGGVLAGGLAWPCASGAKCFSKAGELQQWPLVLQEQPLPPPFPGMGAAGWPKPSSSKL